MIRVDMPTILVPYVNSLFSYYYGMQHDTFIPQAFTLCSVSKPVSGHGDSPTILCISTENPTFFSIVHYSSFFIPDSDFSF